MSLIVAEARQWIGTPYIHQASVRQVGCDCLGLIRGVWRSLNGAEPEDVPHYTQDWGEPQGEEVLWQAAARHLVEKPIGAEAEEGDVLLFRMRAGSIAKHLGVQSETGMTAKFIHAYAKHGVLESPLTGPWQRRIAARFQYQEG